MKRVLAVAVVMLAMAQSPVWAGEATAYKETKLGLYASALESKAMLDKDSRAILIDVRDPTEIMFTGWAEETDIHVPWILTDRSQFDAEKGAWKTVKNTKFEAQIAAALAARGARPDDVIVVMCRSGATRSAPAADVIAEMGYSKVYSMSDGFEGDTLKDGPSKGVRAVNGWRNSGLPWSYKSKPGIAWIETP